MVDAADLKSAVATHVGSTPTLATKIILPQYAYFVTIEAICADKRLFAVATLYYHTNIPEIPVDNPASPCYTAIVLE